jgi:hypothetical protein
MEKLKNLVHKDLIFVELIRSQGSLKAVGVTHTLRKPSSILGHSWHIQQLTPEEVEVGGARKATKETTGWTKLLTSWLRSPQVKAWQNRVPTSDLLQPLPFTTQHLTSNEKLLASQITKKTHFQNKMLNKIRPLNDSDFEYISMGFQNSYN